VDDIVDVVQAVDLNLALILRMEMEDCVKENEANSTVTASMPLVEATSYRYLGYRAASLDTRRNL
jgi:hypothetical protein